MPSYVLSNLITHISNDTAKRLDDIFYPSVLVLYLGYKRNSIKRELDGFGFLIPKRENKSFLGAIWNSVLFPERTSDDDVCFTLFIGGAQNDKLNESNIDEFIDKAKKEFSEIMNINDDPVFISSRFWKKAIPQYNLSYSEQLDAIESFEKDNPGFFIGGNFRRGIALGDCLHSAEIITDEVKKYFK